MTAEEMFKKLGYIKYIRPVTGGIVYRKENFFVEFIADNKTVVTELMVISFGNTVTYRAFEVDAALFQAIKKQLEELEWIE